MASRVFKAVGGLLAGGGCHAARMLAGGGTLLVLAGGTSGARVAFSEGGRPDWNSSMTSPVLPAEIPGFSKGMHVLRRTPYTVRTSDRTHIASIATECWLLARHVLVR